MSTKSNRKILNFFIFFLSSLSCTTQKLYSVCKYYAQQTTALLMEIIPTCLELHVSYNWQATASKLSLRCFASSFGHFFGLSNNNCVGVACMVTPNPSLIPRPKKGPITHSLCKRLIALEFQGDGIFL